MPVITLTWNSLLDAKTCNKCRALHGRRWVIVADELPHVISHPHYGDVYDLRMDESLAHGYGPWHCRCRIFVDVSYRDLMRDVENLEAQTGRLNDQFDSTLDHVLNFLSALEGY